MWVASQDAQEFKTIREPTAFSPLGDPKLPHKKKKTVRAVTKYTQKDIKVYCLCSILLDFFTLLKIFCPGLKMKIEKPWLKWKLFFCEFISYVIIKLYVVYFTAPTLLKTAHTTRKRSMLDIILKLPNPVRSS